VIVTGPEPGPPGRSATAAAALEPAAAGRDVGAGADDVGAAASVGELDDAVPPGEGDAEVDDADTCF
jgi:hypothetical protein